MGHPISLVARPRSDGGRRVLIIDESSNVVSALMSLLSDEGMEVAGAQSVEQAFAKVIEAAPDIAVLDIEMRGRRDVSLLRLIRARRPDLPVVVVSGLPDDHPLMVDARSAEADAFVAKPIVLDELNGALRGLFATRAAAGAA